MKGRFLMLAFLGLVGLQTAACGGLPTVHYYLLEPRPVPRETGLTEAGPKGLRIGVADFRIDPPFDQDRIVYRAGQGDVQVGFYAYHRWAVPLSRMLPKLAASELAASGGVAFMEPAVSGRDYDALLKGRLMALQEIDGGEAGIQASLRLQLSLTGRSGDLLWSGTVARHMVVSQTRDVAGIVTAMQEVVQEALSDVKPRFEAAVSATLAGADVFPLATDKN